MPAGIAIKAFWYHLIAWPVSAFIAMWPAVFKRFGVGVWTYVFNTVYPIAIRFIRFTFSRCWFGDSTDPWNYAFMGMVTFVWVYCVICYGYGYFRYSKDTKQVGGEWGEADRSAQRSLGWRLSAYLLVYIICWAPTLVPSPLTLTHPHSPTFNFFCRPRSFWVQPMHQQRCQCLWWRCRVAFSCH